MYVHMILVFPNELSLVGGVFQQGHFSAACSNELSSGFSMDNVFSVELSNGFFPSGFSLSQWIFAGIVQWIFSGVFQRMLMFVVSGVYGDINLKSV